MHVLRLTLLPSSGLWRKSKMSERRLFYLWDVLFATSVALFSSLTDVIQDKKLSKRHKESFHHNNSTVDCLEPTSTTTTAPRAFSRMLHSKYCSSHLAFTASTHFGSGSTNSLIRWPDQYNHNNYPEITMSTSFVFMQSTSISDNLCDFTEHVNIWPTGLMLDNLGLIGQISHRFTELQQLAELHCFLFCEVLSTVLFKTCQKKTSVFKSSSSWPNL